jgi:hypothetical protein
MKRSKGMRLYKVVVIKIETEEDIACTTTAFPGMEKKLSQSAYEVIHRPCVLRCLIWFGDLVNVDCLPTHQHGITNTFNIQG